MASRLPARVQPGQPDVVVVGAGHQPLRDVYHILLRRPWWVTLAIIVGGYLGANVLFAVGYLYAGGVANARHGSFLDALFFSVQTMGTVGYGAMYPQSLAANTLVVAESVAGLVITAIATGMVFSKFSQSTARLEFARWLAIAPMDGVPTLMVRVGNERTNVILEATVRIAMVRTERTREGVVFYRLYDLALTRDRSPALARSWTVMHPITPASPLHGMTPESLKTSEAEFLVSVVGTDDTSLQPVHGRHTYKDTEVLWGARHADVLSELPDGRLQLDVRHFHETVPTKPTEIFPYPPAG